MEANRVYFTMDQANQQLGLKLLVSQCKRYEQLLGIKYTLQTCVWYNLDGIERFFDDMCAELEAESAKHTNATPEKGTDYTSVGTEKKHDDTEEVIADYVVKKSEEFNDGGVADNETMRSRVNLERNNVSEVNGAGWQRSDEHDSEGSETILEQEINETRQGLTSVDSESDNLAETSHTAKNCWVVQSPPALLSEQKKKNKTPIAAGVEGKLESTGSQVGATDALKTREKVGNEINCTKVISLAEPDNNAVETSMGRLRKQKHPTRKVSPLKISLKKRLSKKSESFDQGYIKAWTVKACKDTSVARKNKVEGNIVDDSDNTIGELSDEERETCTGGTGKRDSRMAVDDNSCMGKKSSGQGDTRSSSVEEADSLIETVDDANIKAETSNKADIETGSVVGEAIILGSATSSTQCTSSASIDTNSHVADKKKTVHANKFNRLVNKAQLMKALDINPKKNSKVKTGRNTSQLKQLKMNLLTTQKMSKHKQLKRDRAGKKRVRYNDCSNTTAISDDAKVNGVLLATFARESPPGTDKLSNGLGLEEQYECTVCRLIFQSRKALTRHRNTNGHCVRAWGRQVDRHFLCQQCGKAYYKKHGLQRHMRLHGGEKGQMCKYCDFRCHEVNNLKRHMALHFESQRNFVCEICGAAFHAKKTLESHHIYKHNNERKFQCSQCFLSFKEKSALKRHEKTHSLEKEHKCVCGTAFRRICNLRRHLKLVHGGDENYLPPVKHVSTLDLRKKKLVSKSNRPHTFSDDFKCDLMYDDMQEANAVGPTSTSEADSGTYTQSENTYRLSLLNHCNEGGNDSSSSMAVTDHQKLPDHSSASVSDYSQHERNTPSEVIQKQGAHPLEQSMMNHEASQQLANREMLVSNFMFPHLAMATNNFADQQAPVLPHIHMLQNSHLKDNVQTPIPSHAPPKFTFTFGNHWQKFNPSDLEDGFKEHEATKSALENMKECSWNEHSFRFPSSQFVNQDSRGALQSIVGQDARSASQGIGSQDPRSVLHRLLDQDSRGALQGLIHQNSRGALQGISQDPRGVIQELIHQDPRGALQGLLQHEVREGFTGHVNQDSRGSVSGLLSQDPRETLQEDINMRIQEEDLSQNSMHDSQSDLGPGKLVIDESSYTSPYQLSSSYIQQTSYEPVVTNEKANMSQQSEESEYFQSRREIAAESLTQLAELAMEASYQQQSNADQNSQLL